MKYSPRTRLFLRLSALTVGSMGFCHDLRAQVAYTWGGSSGGAWLNTANWSDGPAGTFPGTHAGATTNGTASDVAVFANTATNVGLNLNTAGGAFEVGAISLTGSTALQIGNSSGTVSGVLKLNGATLNGVAGTLLSANGANLTIANVNAGAGTQTMGLQLGTTSGVLQAAASRTLTISSNITESTVGSGILAWGGGTVTLSGTVGYTGTTIISNATTFGYTNVAANASMGGLVFGSSRGYLATVATQGALTFSSISAGNGAFGIIGSTGASKIIIGGTPVTNDLIAGNLYFGGSNIDGRSFAVIDSGTKAIRAMNYATDNGAVISSGTEIPAANANQNIDLTTGISAQPTITIKSLLADRNNVVSSLTLQSDATLTISSGGLAASSLSTATFTITGGVGLTTSDNNTLFVRTQRTNGNFVINTPIIGTQGLSISGQSTTGLTLGAANTFSGDTRIINSVTTGLSLNNRLALQNSTLDMNTDDTGTIAFTAASASATPYTLGGLKGGRALALGAAFVSVGNNNQSTTYSGVITGTNGLTKIGTGTLTLTNANTFTGAATVTGGVINLANANAIQNSTATISSVNGLTFAAGIGTFNLGGLAGASALDLTDLGSAPVTLSVGSNNAATTYSGALSGAGGLTKVGTGNLNLTGVSSHTGVTKVNAGFLSVSSDAALGAVPGAATPGNIILAGGSLSASANLTLNANRGIALGPGSGSIGATNNVGLTYGGVIADNGGTGNLVILGSGSNGSGSVTLTGASTYTGTTTVLDSLTLTSSLVTGVPGPLGTSTSDLLIGQTSGTSTSSLRLGNGVTNPAYSFSRNITLQSGGTGAVSISNGQNSNTVTVSGNIILGNTGSAGRGLTASTGGGGNTLVFSGNLLRAAGATGAGDTLTVNGNGQLVLSGTANTYAGGTIVNAGNSSNSLVVNAGSSLGPGPLSFIAPTGKSQKVTLNNAQQTIGNLSSSFTDSTGTATQILALNGTELTINQTSDSTFGNGAVPTLTSAITGTGRVVKAGTAVLTFTGPNAYTGGTVVNEGTLTVGSGGTLAGPTGALAVNNPNTGPGTAVALNLSTSVPTVVGSLSGTLAFPASGTNTATIDNGGQLLTVNQSVAGTFRGTIAGSGGLTLGASSTSKLTLAGVQTYTGGTTVLAGTLDASTGSIISSTGPMSVSGTGSQLIAAKVVPVSLTVGVDAKVSLTNIDTPANLTGRSSVGSWDNSGLVDLGKTGIVFGSATEATIRAQIIAARNGGNWTGTTGIGSSNAAANPTSRSVGYLVGVGQITVAQTLLGDANLDAIVNIDDLSVLAQNYNLSGQNWQAGDFNYDDTVNIDDLSLLAQNYNLTSGDFPQTPPPSVSAQFAADFATVFGSAAVPEPGSAGLIGLATAGLLSLRRRRRGTAVRADNSINA